jgi:hypothetical protein
MNLVYERKVLIYYTLNIEIFCNQIYSKIGHYIFTKMKNHYFLSKFTKSQLNVNNLIDCHIFFIKIMTQLNCYSSH